MLACCGRPDALRWLRDELAGQLANRMTAEDVGRAPILERKSKALVELVARRDLLRARTNMVRHEIEREKLITVLPSRREGQEA